MTLHEVSDYIQSTYGFRKLRGKDEEEFTDIDAFDYILRVDAIHYLFWSELHKAFTLGLQHENPKGKAGGGIEYWKHIMIPVIINTRKEAKLLLDGLLQKQVHKLYLL